MADEVCRKCWNTLTLATPVVRVSRKRSYCFEDWDKVSKRWLRRLMSQGHSLVEASARIRRNSNNQLLH